MSEMYDKLQEYFEKTPQEQLDKDWDDVKYLNDIGPYVILYDGYVRHLKERYDDKLVRDIVIINYPLMKLSFRSICLIQKIINKIRIWKMHNFI
jgi:hypothetical protein